MNKKIIRYLSVFQLESEKCITPELLYARKKELIRDLQKTSQLDNTMFKSIQISYKFLMDHIGYVNYYLAFGEVLYIPMNMSKYLSFHQGIEEEMH